MDLTTFLGGSKVGSSSSPNRFTSGGLPCKEIDKDGLLKGEMSPGVALLLFLAVFPASLDGFLAFCSVVFLREGCLEYFRG